MGGGSSSQQTCRRNNKKWQNFNIQLPPSWPVELVCCPALKEYVLQIIKTISCVKTQAHNRVNRQNNKKGADFWPDLMDWFISWFLRTASQIITTNSKHVKRCLNSGTQLEKKKKEILHLPWFLARTWKFGDCICTYVLLQLVMHKKWL